MSTTTTNLGLFKYDTSTDANVAFSITKALNNNWDIIDAKCGSSNNILDFKWSDHLLNDMSWLRADTFSWQNGTSYSLAYNELLSEYNNSASTTKTDGSITYKLTPKGYKIALPNQETAILNKYNSDGIAWYYILDTTNKKFKLPRAKHPSLVTLTSTAPVVGNGMTLGLTDGLSNYGIAPQANYWGIYASQSVFGSIVGTDSTGYLSQDKSLGVTTDPTKSGIVADLSSNVKDYNMYLYFYVGNFTKSAEAQTAGLKAELLNGKADVDAPSIQASYLKDTYVNGTSGYRIWSDGYCEQWGKITNSTAKYHTITPIKKFSNANYNVNAVMIGLNQDYIYTIQVMNVTQNNFSLYSLNLNEKRGCFWKACGYLATDQY